jgi:hypothetical protein
MTQMERGECMMILENKVTHHQLAKAIEDLKLRAENSEKAALSKWDEMERGFVDKMEKLKEKLGGKRKEKKSTKTTHPL